METSKGRAGAADGAGAITISVNGEDRQLAAGMSLNEVLEALSLDPRKVAVERNLEIAPRSQYAEIRVEPGDRLEIVHFVGGG